MAALREFLLFQATSATGSRLYRARQKSSPPRKCANFSKNKCIGDDTIAAARQNPNCIKKIQYGEKRFSIWRMELLHRAMWHDHDIDFARWLHHALWHSSGIMTVNSPSGSTLQCDRWLWDDMPWNSPKRPPYWNSTSFFDFDHITAVGMSFCTSLRNFIQIGPPSAEKNDVMSIFKMADLTHLGF